MRARVPEHGNDQLKVGTLASLSWHSARLFLQNKVSTNKSTDLSQSTAKVKVHSSQLFGVHSVMNLTWSRMTGEPLQRRVVVQG